MKISWRYGKDEGWYRQHYAGRTIPYLWLHDWIERWWLQMMGER